MRDILKVYGPAILILVVAGIIGWHFILPAPPKFLRIAAGSEKGMYWSYAEHYAALLAADGITLEIEKTDGSVDNLTRLSDHQVGLYARIDVAGIVITKNPIVSRIGDI